MGAPRAATERRPFEADIATFTSVDANVEGRLQYEEDCTNGLRVTGVTFLLDGSPQGHTARHTLTITGTA